MKLLSALAILPALALATKPEPEEITIKSVTHSGNGCPQGSTATSINQDRTVCATADPHTPPTALTPPRVSPGQSPH